MDYRYLRYFIAVAEEHNMTRAAERLHTVQPSLSAQIRRLEEIVGTPLFYRDKKRFELTEAGQVFLQEARLLLAHTDRAINLARMAARAESGRVTAAFVSGTETNIFPRFLPLLRAKFPQLELDLRTMAGPDQLEALHEHTIDVGFLGGPITDPEIAHEVILRQEILAIIPAQHAIARLKQIPLKTLSTIPIVRPSRKGGLAAYRQIEEMENDSRIRFRTACEVDDVLAALNAVASGVGFAFLPDYVQQILPPHVVTRSIDLDPKPTLNLLVAYRKDNRLPALKLFLDLLRKSMEDEPKTASKPRAIA